MNKDESYLNMHRDMLNTERFFEECVEIMKSASARLIVAGAVLETEPGYLDENDAAEAS